MATHIHTPDSKATTTRPEMTGAMLLIMQWSQLHDLITLAQHTLGEGPKDFCEMFIVNCEVQLTEACNVI